LLISRKVLYKNIHSERHRGHPNSPVFVTIHIFSVLYVAKWIKMAVVIADQGWKMASKKPRFLKIPKNPKCPKFRLFYFLAKFFTNHI